MAFPVKWFSSDMNGSPRCSGTAGDMIALLDACLTNGFNVNAVASLEVVGGVATATFGVQHGYLQHQIVLIAGATPSGLNGEKRVLTSDTNTITFDATGLADGTATGTIECRTAPVGGWEKTYSDTQKGAYRSTDVSSTGLYLRVDDTGTNNAIVNGYESMSDIDTGVAQFGNYYWRKSSTADTTARDYVLIADSKTIYLAVAWKSTAYEFYSFGDFTSYLPADSYNCQIMGNINASPANPGENANNSFAKLNSEQSVNMSIARSYTQTVGAVNCYRTGSILATYFGRNDSGSGIPDRLYPDQISSNLFLHYPVLLHESSFAGQIRGHARGILHPLQIQPLAHGDIVEIDIGEFDDKKVFMIAIAITYFGATNGRIAIDITGDW